MKTNIVRIRVEKRKDPLEFTSISLIIDGEPIDDTKIYKYISLNGTTLDLIPIVYRKIMAEGMPGIVFDYGFFLVNSKNSNLHRKKIRIQEGMEVFLTDTCAHRCAHKPWLRKYSHCPECGEKLK
ncbi:hypothetical protein ACFL08_01810 [Patescibacteria group bacterium]